MSLKEPPFGTVPFKKGGGVVGVEGRDVMEELSCGLGLVVGLFDEAWLGQEVDVAGVEEQHLVEDLFGLLAVWILS